MSVHFECLSPVTVSLRKRLRLLIHRILAGENHDKWEMTLILTDSRHLRRLNRRYRKKDLVTDVISFALRDGVDSQFGGKSLGDVFISLPRARRQAREFGVRPQEEICRLAVHGTLHLLGYDHHRSGPARLMRNKENEYLATLKT
jgi:probable rRNA maturation factor